MIRAVAWGGQWAGRWELGDTGARRQRRDCVIDHSNLEDYADPILYDAENTGFEPDGPFYLSLAQEVGGSALELGCGTGRVTIPLARHGIDVTGLDIVPGMLDRARNRAGDLSIRWIEADVRHFRLERQFSLSCEPGRVFQHLLERRDQEAMLARAREHLSAGGLLVLALRFPRPESMENVEEEQEWLSYTDACGRGVRMSGRRLYDPVRQVLHETAFRRWHGAEGDEVTVEAGLTLRYVFPQEMEALLHHNGFTVLRRYGNWNSSPLTVESRIMIYVCGRTM